MKYLISVMPYQAKNKLHAAAIAYIKEFDRLIISQQSLARLKIQIVDNLHALNEAHPKCKPLNPSWSPNYSSEIYKDESLYFDEANQPFILKMKIGKETTP